MNGSDDDNDGDDDVPMMCSGGHWCRRGVISSRCRGTRLGPTSSVRQLAGARRSAAAAASAAGDGVGQLGIQHHRQPS